MHIPSHDERLNKFANGEPCDRFRSLGFPKFLLESIGMLKDSVRSIRDTVRGPDTDSDDARFLKSRFHEVNRDTSPAANVPMFIQHGSAFAIFERGMKEPRIITETDYRARMAISPHRTEFFIGRNNEVSRTRIVNGMAQMSDTGLSSRTTWTFPLSHILRDQKPVISYEYHDRDLLLTPREAAVLLLEREGLTVLADDPMFKEPGPSRVIYTEAGIFIMVHPELGPYLITDSEELKKASESPCVVPRAIRSDERGINVTYNLMEPYTDTDSNKIFFRRLLTGATNDHSANSPKIR